MKKKKSISSLLFFSHDVSNLTFNQSIEWNEEPIEEQGAESPPGASDDICAQNTERKEDNMVNGTEENEWDRLLRLR